MVNNNSRKLITEFVVAGFDNVERPLAVGVVMLILYILTMVANTVNICFIVMDKRLHQPMYIFICHLAIVDMLYCTSSCPTMIGILLIGYKTISYKPCIVQMFAFHYGGSMEMFAIAVMAFDRFVAISIPLRYSSLLTNLRCVLITILLWLVVASVLSMLPASIESLPVCYSTIKYMFCDYASITRASCADPEPYFNDASILTTCLIFGTFSFICLSYVKIVIVISRMTSNTDKKKAIHTCLSHIIVITCYYVPTFTRIVLTRVGVVLTLEERNGLMVGSIIVPSLVNPFIYCFRTKEIRNKLFKIFSKVEPVVKRKQ
ncbi:olfactory receptor 10G4-like [Pangasianodon hypophthalmus]|uniref:olfactory receptor 10G4-like n=1 Tax=Pangasianodon hypophthalmus TaxID=310915 RepID=UPI000EFF994E|nr:olfactory receptor 10G4-like [Pangasianodon hypophthalmus]